MILQRSTADAPEAALADSNIGCRRGFVHALGARAELDEYVLFVPIKAPSACLSAMVFVAIGACTLVCVPECLQGRQLPSRT